MNTSLEILKKQLENGFLPQAYLFWGDDIEAKEMAIEYVAGQILGSSFRSHSNFYEVIPEGENGRGNISIDTVRDLRRRAMEKPFDIEFGKFDAKNVFL